MAEEVIKMNYSDFVKLPLLVRPGEAAAVLGIRARDLKKITEEGFRIVLPGMVEPRYRKRKLAELAGLIFQ